MTPHSFGWKTVAVSLFVLLSANLGVLAQTPTQTWTPSPTCTNGLPTPASSSGTYIDAFGANWAVYCAQDSTGFSYDAYEGPNGHGVYSCFLGCDNRPGCTAFMYTGTVTGPNTGAGKCYYKYTSGTYYSNSTVYGSANLISNGTPNKPCPYYNQITYTDANGNVYQVYCGSDLGGGSAIAGTYRSDGMASCMTTCDSTSGCTSFTYTYTGAEPLEGAQNTDGTCNLRSGTATVNSAPNPSVGAAIRVGTTSVSQASTSTATSSNTPATSACNLPPSPSAPSCPSASGVMFTDPCGTNYTVYCGNDTSPGSVSSGTANSIIACMQLCDNYSGCVAATLAGTTCYLKTSFTAVTTTTNSALVALVRYVPPNPNYAVPPLAPCQNCSSGCGSALPSGITINAASSVLINFNNPSDGLLRNYTIHIPQYYDINHASPLILAFHGNGDNAAGIESQTGMSKASLNPYGIAVYVNGYGKGFESNPSWAPGGTYSYVDDIGFIKNLIANLTQTYCIDTGRIFAVGHSNGGGFTGVMACDPVLSVKIAVFAANSGAFYTNFTTGDPATIEPVNTPVQPLCLPGRDNVPYIEFHGTADTQIRYYGDTTHNGRILPSLPHWSTAWSTRDEFGTTNYSTTVNSNAIKYQFGGNGAGQLGIITHYMLIGWIHAWASVSAGAPIDASPPIMDFFYRWSDPNRASLNAPNYSSSSSSTQPTSTSSSSSSSSSISMPFTTTTTSTTQTTTTSTTTSTTSTSTTTTTSTSSSSSSSSSMSSISSSSLASSTSSSSIPSSTMSSSSSSNSLSSNFSGASSSSSSGSSLSSVSSTMSSISPTSSTPSSPITSSSSSSRASSSSTSTQSSSSTASGLACPAANGPTYTDPAGIPYMIGCGADTMNGNYAVTSVGSTGSFNDCLTLCSSNYQSATNCTSFTYVGNSATGAGPGACFLKNISPDSFRSADSLHIAAIRMQNYVPGSYIPDGGSATTTSTTTSSASSGSSISSTQSSSSSAMQTTSGSSTSHGSSTGQSGSTGSGQITSTLSSSTSISSSSQSSSSSATSPSASCVPGPSTDTNGKSYTILCNSDTTTGAVGTQQFDSGDYTQCMPACDSTSGCNGWTWQPYQQGGGICYLKTGHPIFTGDSPGYVGGILASSSSTSTVASSTSSQVSGQSITSSAATTSSSSGSQSSAVASCPGSNGQTVTDTVGVQYQIACSSDTTGGNYQVYPAPNGFTDCFSFCDNSQSLDSTQCTAFVYAGSANGAGPGQCFVKNGAGLTLQTADNTHVAAIRVSSSSSSTSSGSSATSSSAAVSMTSMSTTAAQGGTASMSSTRSSPSPSAMVCQNNTQITDVNDKTYTIYCNADTSGAGGFAQQPFDNGDFTQCNTACDATTNCGAWVWVPYVGNGGGVCYLKQLPQTYMAGSAGCVAGILVSAQSTTSSSSLAASSSAAASSGASSSSSSGATSTTISMQSSTISSSASPSPTLYGPQCSAANGTTYTDPTGVQYIVLCDMDTAPGAVGTSPEPDFGHCIDACSQQTMPSCVAVTYTGGTCYFKSQYQSSSSSPGVEAAVLLSMVGSGSSPSSSRQSSQTSSLMTSSSMSSGVSVSSTHRWATSSTAAGVSSSSPAVGMTITSTSAAVPRSLPASLGGMTTQSPSGQSSTNAQQGSMTSSTVSLYQSTSLPPPAMGTATAPPCPTSSSDLCAAPGESTTCSSSSGNTYNTSCGIEYQGTVIDTSGITGKKKRATEPTFQDCQSLCDHTTGCVALNYKGTNCTLLSSVTGSTMVPGAVSANIVSFAPPSSGTSSVGTIASSSMSNSMSMSAKSPTTTSMAMSSSPAATTTSEASSTGSLSACSTQSTGPQSSGGSSCADTYGNPFNVTYGKAYTGTITVRAVKPNLDSCLTLCDTTPGCLAVNYIGNECQVLTQVTGTTTTTGAAAGATRPPDVSTVYTAPPTTSASPTREPASNGASPTISNGGGGGVSTGMQTSNGGMPGSTPDSPSTTTGQSPGGSSGGSSSGSGPGMSTMNTGGGNSNQPTGTVIGGTTYMSTNGNAPTTQVTMANPSYTPSSTMAGGPSGPGGGPGPVSGGNSGIVSGATSSPSGGSSQGTSGPINTNSNQATASATSSSTPASTGPVCPNYDDQHYIDQKGATYNIRYNIRFTGDIISSTDSTSTKHKRASTPWTEQSCMQACDGNTACKAIVLDDCLGTCTLLASVDPVGPPSYFCGFSARKLKGPNDGSGGNNVVTVTVCAAQRTRTTTVLTTATLKTCPANAQCTAGGERWLAS